MTEQQTLKAPQSFVQNQNEPAPLGSARQIAWNAYQSTGNPDPQHESWRKIRLESRGFDAKTFQLFADPALALPKPTITNPHPSQVVVAEFSEILASQSSHADYAKIIQDHLSGLTTRIGSPIPEGGATNQGVMTDREPLNVFQLQNLACHHSATFVATRATLPAAEPVRIRHTNAGRESVIQRTLIYAAPGSELTVVEEFRSNENENETKADDSGEHAHSLWNCETYIICGDNARVNYISLRHYAGDEYNFHRIESNQYRDSRVHVSIAQHGGHAGKCFVTGRLNAPGGEFRGIGLTAASQAEYVDMEMLAAHDADHTASSLLYKAVVRDRAHSVFNGNLLIPPGRKHVDSHQTNNNILLNKKARAESMPKLIVKAEDVSAEHGATVGELDPEAIFFLMSRGLPESDARLMLIEGFLMQVIAEFPVPDLHEELFEDWKSKLAL